MRSDIIRVYKTLHTWTGIITGMALFIAFYAGALTVFKEPIARWASPPSAGVAATPLSDTGILIQQVLQAQPKAASDFMIHLQDEEHRLARMHWQEVPEGADEHDLLAPQDYAATLNADGDVHISQPGHTKLAEFIDTLHRVVGLPVDTDLHRLIMGVISILYGLALISGVIVLLPTLTKDFFALRLGKKNLKRQWLDAHNVVGIASLPFHLIMAITAAVFAFHDPIYGIQDKLVHEQPIRSMFRASQPAPMPKVRDASELLPVATLLQTVEGIAPEFEPTLLQYVRIDTPHAMVRVWGFDDRTFGSRAWGGFAVMNPFSGEVLSTDYMPGLQDTPNAFVSSFFSLHFATFGGEPLRWLYFLLGLAGAWLFYSGNLLWVETRRKKQRRDATLPAQRRDTWFMAAATVGVCVGSIAGISLTMVLHKWLAAYIDSQTLRLQGVYYTVFFGFIFWAFWRGSARAAAPLLWLAALFTAAIPLTSLVAWLIPSLGLWAHASVATLGVDATALVGALCLAAMARATRQRVARGLPDSVWSTASA